MGGLEFVKPAQAVVEASIHVANFTACLMFLACAGIILVLGLWRD